MTGYEEKGYHKLANLIRRDKSLAIFRRFDDVNILCLLQLQAEILKLRKELHIVSHVDNTQGNGPEARYAENFKLSKESDSRQYDLITEIRGLLREYNELLLQFSQLNRTESPRPPQLDALKGELRNINTQGSFLVEEEQETWDSLDPSIYIAAHTPDIENDPFTNFVKDKVLIPYHTYIGQHTNFGTTELNRETNLASYDDAGINTAVNVVTAMLSSILPVLTIFVLNKVDTTNARIGFTVLFTAVFAAMLAYFSTARRVEIFAATATFAAVEVVFIGSAISSGAPVVQPTSP